MADILNSIIHSSDNAVNGLYNAMSIRRQREQDTQAEARNAYTMQRGQAEDKHAIFERAAQIVGGRPENVELGLNYLRMNGPEPDDPRVGEMLVAYGQSGQGGDAYGTIVWGEDSAGNPIAMQPTKDGKLVRSPIPEGVSRLTVPMQNLNLNDQILRVPSRGSGGPTESYAVGISPDQQPGLKGAQRDAINASDTAAIPEQTPLLAEQERQQTAAREGAITAEIPTRAAAKGPADASVASLVTTATKQAEFSASAANEAFSSLNKIRAATVNIDDAIAAIDSGAESGPVMSLLPSVQTASVELDNIQGKMGLDVIGATTFGALSKDERLFALDVALPTKLDPPELRAWLKRKKDAQLKMAAQLENAAIFLSKPGNTPAMYLEKIKAQSADPVSALQNNLGEKLNTSVELPVGTVRRGYIYQGGDPSKQESWKKQ